MKRCMLDNMTPQNKARLHVAGLVLLLLPFFHPGYVSVCVPWLDLIYKAGKVISAAVVFALSLRELGKSRYVSKAALALIVTELWMLGSIVVHQGFQGHAILSAMSVLVVCALAEIQMRRHARQMLDAFLLVYELLIVINFASMLIAPKGLYVTTMQWRDNWFIGYRNMFIFYFAPSLALELVNRHAGGSALRFYGMLAVCTASMVMAGSATGLLCMLAFLALCLTGLYRVKIVNILSVTAVSLTAFFTIVVLNLQNTFKPIFDLLGREVTFTGRTTIWKAAMECIAQNPIIGYGMPEEAVRTQMMNHRVGITAHNFILEQMFCFGAVGTALMALFLGIAAALLYKNRKHPYAAALCLGMVCFHLVMLMEGEINNVPMYSFFFLTCCVDQLIDQLPLKKKGGVKRG